MIRPFLVTVGHYATEPLSPDDEFLLLHGSCRDKRRRKSLFRSFLKGFFCRYLRNRPTYLSRYSALKDKPLPAHHPPVSGWPTLTDQSGGQITVDRPATLGCSRPRGQFLAQTVNSAMMTSGMLGTLEQRFYKLPRLSTAKGECECTRRNCISIRRSCTNDDTKNGPPWPPWTMTHDSAWVSR